MNWLQNFRKKHANAHVLVTSRDEIDVREYLEEAAKLSVAECVIKDLLVFMENAVNEIVQKAPWKKSWKTQMQGRIEGINDK